MKTRNVVIHTGERFEVPQGIQRIDHRSTHGWQLRYGGTKLYSDGARGAAAALAAARTELLRRIAKLPAPSRLPRRTSGHKRSDLPVGITGPVVRCRPGSSTMDSSLSVSLPRYGETRAQAEAAYQRAATKAKRAEAQALRAAGEAPQRRAKR